MERARHDQRLSGGWPLTMRDGSRVELPRRSTMTWQIAAEGDYDAHVVACLAQYVARGSIVLDVGASLGLWTLQLAAVARGQDALVHAFEPNPENIPWLRRNIELNGLQAIITIHAMGLGDVRAEMEFGGSEDGVGNGIVLPPGSSTPPEHVVPIRRLDDLSFDRRVSLIKLDVEGFEPAVIRGALQLIESDQPVIFGEFSSVWLKARGESLHRTLDSLGYAAFRLQSKRSRPWRPMDDTAVYSLARTAAHAENLLLIPTTWA
jgi:FkbM family methyltransferase